MTGSGAKLAFDEVDPFNANRVAGYVLRSRRRRGDLEITHVNGVACPQYVRATPRMASLEDHRGLDDFDRAEVFEKIDGTNVLLYRYRDADGASYVSYKTRLSPFLRLQPYGDFVALWNEVVARYQPGIAALAEARHSFGFELFGSRLRILTAYETPLDARLLYALDPDTGRIVDPAAIPRAAFPMAARWAEYGAGTSAPELAAALAAQCDQHASVEGAMVYLVRAGFATVYKFKPAVVRERQARYRELYAQGKAAERRDRGAVLAQVASYVERQWSAELRAQHRSVIEIVREDLANELAFAAPSRDARPSPLADMDRVLWTTLWGSHLWGMARPESDTDSCSVYRRTAIDPAIAHDRRPGWHRKTAAGDEHYYELGSAVALLLRGSLTLLLGVMSPVVVSAYSTAHAELRGLLEAAPSRVFYRALLRDVKDSERVMARAHDRAQFLKHLRIACRNLRFAITLFSEGRYEFQPSSADDPAELEDLRREMHARYRASSLPDRFDDRPFADYVARWRTDRHLP